MLWLTQTPDKTTATVAMDFVRVTVHQGRPHHLVKHAMAMQFSSGMAWVRP
jgi:hypothetical protein